MTDTPDVLLNAYAYSWDQECVEDVDHFRIMRRNAEVAGSVFELIADNVDETYIVEDHPQGEYEYRFDGMDEFGNWIDEGTVVPFYNIHFTLPGYE